MLVAGLVVVVSLKSWVGPCLAFLLFLRCCSAGGQKTTTGLQILFVGVETTSLEGGCKDNNRSAAFVSKMWW